MTHTLQYWPSVAPFHVTLFADDVQADGAALQAHLRTFAGQPIEWIRHGFATKLTAWSDGVLVEDADGVVSYDLTGPGLRFVNLMSAAAVTRYTQTPTRVEADWDGKTLTIVVTQRKARRLLVMFPLLTGQLLLADRIEAAASAGYRYGGDTSPCTLALAVPDLLATIAAHLDASGTWQRSHPDPAGDDVPAPIKGTTPPLALVRDLERYGLADWPEQALEPLIRLSDGWTGSVDDLVHVASSSSNLAPAGATPAP